MKSVFLRRFAKPFRLMLSATLLFLLTASLALTQSRGFAQDPFDDLKKLEEELKAQQKALLEGFEAFDMSMPSFSGSISMSTSVDASGRKTTTVKENGKTTKIVETPEEKITISYSKVYGPDDLEALEQEHPELYMHYTSFPKGEGEDQVILHVEVKTTIEADDADDLKIKDAQAYALYEKYTKQKGRVGGRMRAVPLPRIIPRVEKEEDEAEESSGEEEEKQDASRTPRTIDT